LLSHVSALLAAGRAAARPSHGNASIDSFSREGSCTVILERNLCIALKGAEAASYLEAMIDKYATWNQLAK
jgi:hypothetical protein